MTRDEAFDLLEQELRPSLAREVVRAIESHERTRLFSMADTLLGECAAKGVQPKEYRACRSFIGILRGRVNSPDKPQEGGEV